MDLVKIVRTHFRRLLRNNWGRDGYGLRMLHNGRGLQIVDRRVQKSGTRRIVMYFDETLIKYSDDYKHLFWKYADLADPQSFDQLEQFVFGAAVADPPERITPLEWCRRNLGE